MSKNLSTILTVFKVAQIIAKVVFIICLVGAGGCLLSLLLLPLVGSLISSQWLAEEGFTILSACLACFTGLIACIGEAVFAYFAERYFANVLSQGTPFTKESGDECFRLGLISIITAVAISVISGIVLGIFIITESADSVELDMSVSLSTGLFLLFISLVFKHGAELQTLSAERDNEKKVIIDTTDNDLNNNV